MQELIKEYKRKRVSAIFGFYVNIGYFIKRIRILVINDSGTPTKTLYLLSSSEKMRQKANGFEELGNKLRNTAYECLQYLSTESNQVPPFDNEKERKEWKTNVNIFVDYLNQFYLIGSGIYLPTLDSEEGIMCYCKEIKKIIDSIEEKALIATDSFYNDMIEEHDN